MTSKGNYILSFVNLQVVRSASFEPYENILLKFGLQSGLSCNLRSSKNFSQTPADGETPLKWCEKSIINTKVNFALYKVLE